MAPSSVEQERVEIQREPASNKYEVNTNEKKTQPTTVDKVLNKYHKNAEKIYELLRKIMNHSKP